MRRAAGAMLLVAVFAHTAAAQDYHSKLTFGTYHTGETTSVDVNVRHSTAAWTGWLGYYGDTGSFRQGRAGLEYDLRHKWLYAAPSIQAAAHGFLGGSLYAEIGKPLYFVAGVSRTNLKPYANLTFDPNDSWQLGGGAHLGKEDSVTLFTIWDNRLHTGQQITHVVLRHSLATARRLTLDVSYKSGHGDAGVYVRGGAEALEYDWRRWFVKLARDEHANYGQPTMWRVGGGVRF